MQASDWLLAALALAIAGLAIWVGGFASQRPGEESHGGPAALWVLSAGMLGMSMVFFTAPVDHGDAILGATYLLSAVTCAISVMLAKQRRTPQSSPD